MALFPYAGVSLVGAGAWACSRFPAIDSALSGTLFSLAILVGLTVPVFGIASLILSIADIGRGRRADLPGLVRGGALGLLLTLGPVAVVLLRLVLYWAVG